MTFTQEFLKSPEVKEHTCYLVNASHGTTNPIHRAILFVGYKNGAYCKVYTNNYERPYELHELYWIEIVKELCSLEER